MPLSLSTREIGKVTIVRCSGRIVTGETDVLHQHVNHLLRDRVNIVLHLGEVGFIDSSGLGTLVRLLTSTRRARGDLKLCQLPELVNKVLKMTNLTTLFDTHASEEDAVLAFYRRPVASAPAAPTGLTVLCVDQSADVLAYLRELLVRSGYNVLTNNNLRDALDPAAGHAARTHHPGPQPESGARRGAKPSAAPAPPPCSNWATEFSTLEAGQAASDLLEKIRAMDSPGPTQSLT